MGASAGLMMATSTASQGVAGIGNAYAQSQAMRAEGTYKQTVANENASLSTIQAQDAINRGNLAADKNNAKTRQLVGTQRADLAAQGIDVNSGSAAEVQSDSSTLGALDSLTIKNNAWREAWGYKTQAMNDTYAGQFASASANTNADNTLLTGGMNAVSSGLKAGYQYSKG